ncbi:MAG: polysaccharide deacetylase family protein [Lentisphaeria bacterium]|nr:polysaccharide deacetylase family protein [Lentisphaeria bacterium]MDP7742410.1 polysaccharide deacetylase family protein [Lentisphaeria bacterium]
MEPFAPQHGAVSLTFDDGRPTQLEHAVPVMDRLDLRGTFYLVPSGDDWRERLEPWCDVARSGHEIGNHTVSHPAPGNLYAVSTACYDELTLDDMERDIREAQARLEQIAPHQEAWTFCYPCYHTDVGTGSRRQSYIPLVNGMFAAGRGADQYGFGNLPDRVDIACIGGLACERMTADEMIGLVEELAIRQGHWVVFVFHDISGNQLSTAERDFRQLCEYIADRKDSLWCAPLVEVAVKIRESRESG